MARRLGWRRAGAALLSTALLGALLYGVDRLAMGPVPPRGWQRVARLAELPPSSVRPPTPPYLPPGLSWPPRQIHYRVDGDGRDDGLWLGLQRERRAALWIGRGARNARQVLGDAATCLQRRCPRGWHTARVRVRDGHRFWVVARVAPRQLARVVSALSKARAR